MAKKLPVVFEPIVTSECWTYCKFAILQTQPYFDRWLLSHMRIFLADNGNAYFGEGIHRYPQSYYSDVFEIGEMDYLHVSKEEIVDLLIEALENGQYVILYLSSNVLKGNHMHEVLLYGYDLEERCFYYPEMHDRFSETKISFEMIEKGFEAVQNHFRKDPYGMFKRRKYLYGITLLKPRENYHVINGEYEFIERLQEEAVGGTAERTEYNERTDSLTTVHSTYGLQLYLALSQMLEEAYHDDEKLQNIYRRIFKTLLKIYESHLMINRAMSCIVETITNHADLIQLHEEYGLCCEEMHKVFLLAIKFNITEKKDVLLIISKKLRELYAKEGKIYKQFAHFTRERYVDELLEPSIS